MVGSGLHTGGLGTLIHEHYLHVFGLQWVDCCLVEAVLVDSLELGFLGSKCEKVGKNNISHV